MQTGVDVRPSPIAGQWYPDDPQQLAESIDRYLAAVKLPEIQGQIVGLVAPHAGHQYSGPVAAHAFAAVRGLQPDTVVIVSPMHFDYDAPLITTAHQAYGTPLGVVEVDRQILDALDELLTNAMGKGLYPVRRDPEHSLEIELPFLQRTLQTPFRLLPLMVRTQSYKLARTLGTLLAQVLEGQNALLVASTDLSHFYPQNVAAELDHEMLRQIEAFDPEGVMRVEEEGKGYACGRAAVAAVLTAASKLGADQVQVVNYATSGDINGDFTRVVGYGAAIITRRE